MIEAASALAPTTCPLCEIELVGNTAAFHSCAPTPGTAEGKLRLPAGTTQETSPLSFEEVACARPPSGVTAVRNPTTGFSANFWKSRAKLCSCSVHFGMPTRSMFFCTASAIVLLPSCGQADAAYCTSQVVPVISAAPSAILTSLS